MTQMSVPLLDLKAQYAEIRDEVAVALQRVLDSQHFILGPEVEALESEVAAYSQCRYGIGVSSGTDALLAALMAIELKPGDEVIVPAYSFFATAGAVARLEARPVFVDIDPCTYNLDVKAAEAAITRKTRAIIPVHLFGQMVDMEPLVTIAQQHQLAVIEDAAQAVGAEYEGRRAGSMGQMGCFSFFPSKNLGGYGDGGMITTNDQGLADRLRLLRGHGARPKYHHVIVGGNFRLDEIQAAVLRVKLGHLEQWTAARQRNADRYRRLFAMTESSALELPVEADGTSRHVYNQFVMRCERRDALRAHLKQSGIETEIYYPEPLHTQPCFADLGHQAGDYPVSEAASHETLALPIYPELTEEMQSKVVGSSVEFYRTNQAMPSGALRQAI
jgi:dTDP-4-amino-4,6-dideoxygalactose transaminase